MATHQKSSDDNPNLSYLSYLYSILKRAQENDCAVTTYQLTIAKFRLRYSNTISQIRIEPGAELDISSIKPPKNTPRFLLSQLEAQELADLDSIPVPISAALLVSCEFLTKDFAGTDTPPFLTLFQYYHPKHYRTYYLFAYHNRSMESRTYTVQELLQLRDTISHATLNKLKANHEVADLIKDKAKMTSTQNRVQNRHLEKVNGDASSSAEESDEILFKGKNKPRGEWRYRGRAGSEAVSNEPIGAPAGKEAQKAEGFQRFFKAVVSPTHVRVTAGGRIVPNNRGSVSPSAKWDKEHGTNGASESLASPRDEKLDVRNSTTAQLSHPLISPSLPGGHSLFPHMGLSMPIFTVPHGIPMAYGLPIPHLAHPAMTLSAPMKSEKHTEEQERDVVKTQDGAGDKKPKPAPIKIMPRDQSDMNRPFYSNGNVIYPAPYGPAHGQMPMMLPSPYFPHGMVGTPALISPHSGSAGHQPTAMPLYGPATVPQSHLYAPHSAGSDSRPPQPPAALKQGVPPHITSIRPSEITKRQLDSLRTSLKYYEDQLQYNKHQIDEKFTLEQAEKVRQSVQHFEHNYRMQLNFEAIHYPQIPPSSAGSTQRGTFWKAASQPSSIRSRRAANASQSSSVSGRNVNLFKASSDQSTARHGGNRGLKGVGINASKEGQGPFAIDPALELLIQANMKNGYGLDESMKNTASSTDNSVAPQLNAGISPMYTPQSGEFHPGVQAGFSGYDVNGWQSAGMPRFDQQGTWNSVQAASTYPANGAVAANTQPPTTSFVHNSYGQPYLIGTLPRGVSAYHARAKDYVYSRELTDAEKEARSNYWGRVPNVGLGLPKFDGKDFYPPSPVKAKRGTDDLSQSSARHALSSGGAVVDYHIHARPAENDPFQVSREPQSIRSQEKGQRYSKAIPIVAPNDVSRGNVSKITNRSPPASVDDSSTAGLSKQMSGMKVSSPTKLPGYLVAEQVEDLDNRRALDRSSTKSSRELWQTMFKKGSASGSALPGAVSSTTATGYLPPYHGHAAASLGPAISNVSNSSPRGSPEAGDKPVENDSLQVPTEKVDENCPPNETRSADYDPVKDVHERMLRDAERRGVIGSEW